ncbi:MAG: PQQ-binding-like beta-propeller repeat protein, partial [Planctomycetes bacterium]|nr:PQQ-binding-like beta-propeller repeat protein [Planctomycetota bacterium]
TTQPLQAYGQFLFVARRRPHSTAIWFVKIDREARPTMTSLWRTVLGARLLAVRAADADTLLCLTEEGYLFHVGRNELGRGGFRVRADAQIQYPEDLAEPVRAVVLPDGQIVVACGAPEPTLWLLNAQGQVRREIPLDEPLEADPIPLGRGLVLPFAGKLGYQGTETRRSRVEGYTAPVKDQEKAPRWVGGAFVDQAETVIADSQGTVLKIQYRTSPQPHLYAAAKWSAGAPIDVPPAAYRDWIIVADSTGRLRLLHRSNFEPLGEVKLPAAVSGRLHLVEDRLLIEIGQTQLLCFRLGRELKQLWAMPLKGQGLADRPLLVDGQMVFAERSGRVCRVQPETGKVTAETMIDQAIDRGPRQLGNDLFVATIDGSLYRIAWKGPAKE